MHGVAGDAEAFAVDATIDNPSFDDTPSGDPVLR